MSTITCPVCKTENSEEEKYCVKCGNILPLSPKKPGRRHAKQEEYVQLYHGPKVKKSTAKKIEQKNEGPTWLIMMFALGMLIVALIKGCT